MISLKAKKFLTKSTSLYNKSHGKNETESTYFHILHVNPVGKTMLNGEKFRAPTKSRNKVRVFIPYTLIQYDV